jgi:hypothetical protein
VPTLDAWSDQRGELRSRLSYPAERFDLSLLETVEGWERVGIWPHLRLVLHELFPGNVDRARCPHSGGTVDVPEDWSFCCGREIGGGETAVNCGFCWLERHAHALDGLAGGACHPMPAQLERRW